MSNWQVPIDHDLISMVVLSMSSFVIISSILRLSHQQSGGNISVINIFINCPNTPYWTEGRPSYHWLSEVKLFKEYKVHMLASGTCQYGRFQLTVTLFSLLINQG